MKLKHKIAIYLISQQIFLVIQGILKIVVWNES